jgi:hypothetical protein
VLQSPISATRITPRVETPTTRAALATLCVPCVAFLVRDEQRGELSRHILLGVGLQDSGVRCFRGFVHDLDTVLGESNKAHDMTVSSSVELVLSANT